MARPPKNSTPGDRPEIGTDVVARVEQQNLDAADHSEQVMALYGDGLSYERHRWVLKGQGASMQMAENMLELGRCLIVIKEHEPHGDFVEILERDFDLAPRFAQRSMQAAAKFLSPQIKPNASALTHLGKAKLYDLMVEDDETLAELADGGTLLGMSLDDIDQMSSRELRNVLRERRAEDEAKDRVSADQRETIQDLQTQLQRVAQVPPDEIDKELREEAGKRAWSVESELRGNFREALVALSVYAEASGVDVEQCLAGHLNQIEQSLADLRAELGVFITLDVVPAWSGTPEGSPDGDDTAVFEPTDDGAE